MVDRNIQTGFVLGQDRRLSGLISPFRLLVVLARTNPRIIGSTAHQSRVGLVVSPEGYCILEEQLLSSVTK
jgi:hypothetical protein